MSQYSFAEMRAIEQSEDLDSILSRYHHWSKGYKATRGFKGKALVIGDYQVSRQYDDCNGALDDDLENTTMQKVDFEINEMQEPFRTAIHQEARSLNMGLHVISSPRLPQDPKERRELVRKARLMISIRLASAGVL